MKPNVLAPKTKALLYKTFCRTKGTYAMESICLKKDTLLKLDIMQNNLIRIFIGLSRKCKMSSLLRVLKIDKINSYYFIQKSKFISRLENHSLTKEILERTVQIHFKYNFRTNSIIKDVRLLSNFTKIDILELCKNDKNRLDKTVSWLRTDPWDGIIESISICLENYTNGWYKNLLNLIIRSFN